MKNSTRLLTILTLVVAGLFLFGSAVYAGNEDAPKKGFVDVDGDGFNDNMKDSDHDGIPNCIDEDMAAVEGEGSGEKSEEANSYMYAYKYAEQLKNLHQLKYELFNERKGEFAGEVPDEVGAWADGGEANLNPTWCDESGSVMDVGHKGGSK